MEGRNQSKSKRTTRTESSPEIAAGAPPCRQAVACGRRRRVAALGRAGAWSGGAGACERVRAVRLCEGVPVRAWGLKVTDWGSRLKYFVGWAVPQKRTDTCPAHVASYLRFFFPIPAYVPFQFQPCLGKRGTTRFPTGTVYCSALPPYPLLHP